MASPFKDEVIRFATNKGQSLALCENQERTWHQLGNLLQRVKLHKHVTFEEYQELKETDEGRLKIGKIKQKNRWMIGCTVDLARRNKTNVQDRRIITLDLDDVPEDLFMELCVFQSHWLNEYACYIHTTLSDCPDLRKIRVILLADREMNGIRYEAVTRILAQKVDPEMKMVDKVSFRPAQLMYLPAMTVGQKFTFVKDVGTKMVDVDEILEEWGYENDCDWSDYNMWPRTGPSDIATEPGKLCEDPHEKEGLIGAFCRVYPISRVISEILAHKYEPAGSEGANERYKYIEGSGNDGLVVYDDKFAHSHHGTDPAEGQNNAWDLVRRHRWPDADKGFLKEWEKEHGSLEDLNIGDYPSQKLMEEWVMDLDEVVDNEIAHRAQDLDDLLDDETDGETEDDDDEDDLLGDVPLEDGEDDGLVGPLPGTQAALNRKLDKTREEPLKEKRKKKKELSKKEKILDEMNTTHAVVMIEGSVYYVTERDNLIKLGSETSMKQWYRNRPWVKKTTIFDFWNEHPQRRQYMGGLVFDPANRHAPDELNIWKGFAIEPNSAGSCEMIIRHIREIVCDDNEEYFDYVIRWLAHLVQKPWQKPDVALVLKGLKGVGKDTLALVVKEIVGKIHYAHVTRTGALTNKFNAQFAHSLFIHVEEAAWGGDKSTLGAFQNMVTGKTLPLEKKGVDVVEVDSYCRIMLTTNEQWAVPATEDERRYAVFLVSDRERNNKRDWFVPLYREINDPECIGAFMQYLMEIDIEHYLPWEDVPQTAGLLEQKISNLQGTAKWWFERLSRGELPASWNEDIDEGEGTWDDMDQVVSKNDLLDSRNEWAKTGQYRGPQIDATQFGKDFLQKVCKVARQKRKVQGSGRSQCYELPPLVICRNAFIKYLGGDVKKFKW